MTSKILYIFLFITTLVTSSCGSDTPSEINFQNNIYSRVSDDESSGGKFDIVKYSNPDGDLHLIIPHNPTDLDKFSNLYTMTFKAQGFTMSSKRNVHIGVSPSKVVYLTVSPNFSGLSIFLINRTPESKILINDALDIFENLKTLQ